MKNSVKKNELISKLVDKNTVGEQKGIPCVTLCLTACFSLCLIKG